MSDRRGLRRRSSTDIAGWDATVPAVEGDILAVVARTAGFGRSLVVGRFLPPHRGHHLLIDEALAHSSSVDVVVWSRTGQRPDAEARRRWLSAIHPAAAVWIVPDPCDDHRGGTCNPGCAPPRARHLAARGLGPWDTVVGQDAGLAALADELGSVARPAPASADPTLPTSRAVRADLASHWSDLHPVTRAGLTRRIVVAGAESTGTTTLAADLADRLAVPWVPEFLRHHAERRASAAGSIWDVEWTPSDFDQVAEGQDELEAATIATWVGDPERSRPTGRGPLVVCDTDALATALWHLRYLGSTAPRFLRRAAARPPALYLLTALDGVEFHQDGLRDGEHVRGPMTEWFRSTLGSQAVPWIEVRGDRSTRRELSMEAIDQLTADPVVFNPG